jgi:hypothetical protein
MEPDDSEQAFDTRLDARLKGAHDAAVWPPEEADEYKRELAVAERITAGSEITPSCDFAQLLKARFLAAAESARGEQRSVASYRPAHTRPSWQSHRVGVKRIYAVLQSRRVQVTALAVTLLIALVTGLLLAASSAPPASPLYAVRRRSNAPAPHCGRAWQRLC